MSRRRARELEGGLRPHAAELAGAAPVFAALGDQTRLGLVARLCTGGPMSIARLTAGAGVTRQAVTKHLHVLAGAGLVRGARVGRDHVWEIEPTRRDEALSRLKASLERET